MTLVEFADRLQGVKWQQGQEGFAAQCPAHDDKTPSLSVNLGDDGRLLVHCHAGCDAEAVMVAVGATLADLFAEPRGNVLSGRNADVRRSRSERPRVVAHYRYADENDDLLFEVVRFDPKDFRQRQPDGKGGWVWNLKGVRRVLYRLPEVLAGVADGQRIYVVEGEKDADALAAAGYCATTMPGGTGQGWRPEFTANLRDADVVVVADADEPGRRHAENVRQALDGVASTVAVVEPAEGNKDTTEHLDAGYGVADFVPARATLNVQAQEPPNTTAYDTYFAGDIGGHRSARDRAAPAWPELDPLALTGTAGDIVGAVAPFTEADPAGLLLDFLASFGNAAGARPHALAGGSRHPARIYPLLVGQTSKGRKGTTRATIAPLFERADPAWSDRRVMGGLSTGEGLIATVADPPPASEDGTPPDPVEERLLVVESEFARVLAVAKRDGSTLSPIVRDAWDSGRLRVMTRKDPLVATGAHITIMGHITVEELRRMLTETDQANGFANRFLFTCVSRRRLLPDGEGVPADVVDHLGQQVHDALKRARNIDKVTRTPEAGELWRALYAEMADDDPGGLVGAVTARAEAQTLRLSVAYAIAAGSPVVDLEHLEAAHALWRYCRASAEYIFGNSIGDEVADRLLNALRAAGPEGLTGSEQSAVFGRHVSASQLEAARDLLGRKRLAVTVTEDTGGRPRVRTTATRV